MVRISMAFCNDVTKIAKDVIVKFFIVFQLHLTNVDRKVLLCSTPHQRQSIEIEHDFDHQPVDRGQTQSQIGHPPPLHGAIIRISDSPNGGT